MKNKLSVYSQKVLIIKYRYYISLTTSIRNSQTKLKTLNNHIYNDWFYYSASSNIWMEICGKNKMASWFIFWQLIGFHALDITDCTNCADFTMSKIHIRECLLLQKTDFYFITYVVKRFYSKVIQQFDSQFRYSFWLKTKMMLNSYV